VGRRAKRRKVAPRIERWRAERDAVGRWTVVDEHGRDVLRSADQYECMRAAHLAAAAPGLLASLQELVRRLDYLELPYTRDHRRVTLAQMEIGAAMPPAAVLFETLQRRAQLELDLRTEVA
jgi:hypothetical protein